MTFDFSHTLIAEQRDGTISLESRPIQLMPGVFEILPRISIPLAVWANTRTANGAELRRFLDRAGIGQFFAWVITSVTPDFESPRQSSLILLYRNAGFPEMKWFSSATNWTLILQVAKSSESALVGYAEALITVRMKRCLPKMFIQPTQSTLFASCHLYFNAFRREVTTLIAPRITSG